MHHANYFYGHAHVLARYVGLGALDPLPRIHGYVQHGWNIGDGLALGTPYVEGCPIFVWSERTRRRAWAQGRHRAIIVGSPWIYLLAMEAGGQDQGSGQGQTSGQGRGGQGSGQDQGSQPEREGTIWYPFHGWESQRVRGSHRRLVNTIKEVETGPVTVCLYWMEYDNPRIRRRYERAGFRVICHGRRGHWWQNSDPEFLYRQLAELRRHRRVASNRVSSALHYGVLAGCEPAVYGDPMVLHNEDPTYGGNARIRRQWSELHGTHIDLATARQISREELGADYLATPEELRHLFGWPSPTGGPQ